MLLFGHMGFEVRVERLLTKDAWVALQALPPKRGRTIRRPLNFGLAAAIAAALMCSSYTFSIFAWTERGSYDQRRYLQSPVEFTITEDHISFSSDILETRATWGNLMVWDLYDGQLRLRCGGMPEVCIPVEALEQAGCMDQVLGMADRYGTKFKP